MRARDVVGRTIVGVKQERFWNENIRAWSTAVQGFDLDNGAFLYVVGLETDVEPYVHAQVIKRSR